MLSDLDAIDRRSRVEKRSKLQAIGNESRHHTALKFNKPEGFRVDTLKGRPTDLRKTTLA